MRIGCKFCHYEYDYERYGESCPQCGTQNKPFRSKGARQMMGLEEASSRFFPQERREEAARAGDPMYGKSALRRLRPFFAVLLLAFAVASLGQGMIRLANEANLKKQPASSQVVRPPIDELADAVYDLSFLPAGGRQLRVNAAGWVKDQPQEENMWLFVDFLLLVQDRQMMEEAAFIPPVAAAGEMVARPRDLPEESWSALYTPLDPRLAPDEPGVSGQLFYLLPAGSQQITLFYQQDERRQSLTLELPTLKNENENGA